MNKPTCQHLFNKSRRLRASPVNSVGLVTPPTNPVDFTFPTPSVVSIVPGLMLATGPVILLMIVVDAGEGTLLALSSPSVPGD